MSISTVNSTTSSTTTTTTTTDDTSTLGITSSDFLTLMVDQLQNQNPLDPTDTDSYIDKLINYASYDTQTAISEQLETITDTLSGTISSSGLGYVGQTIEAEGNTTTLTDGSATWSYTLDEEADSVTVSILDEDGNEVWSDSGDTSSGQHYITWDGTDSDGEQLEDGGTYTISVTALDEDGNEIDGSTTFVGTVTGIDVSDDESVLMVGDAEVSIDSVLSILAS